MCHTSESDYLPCYIGVVPISSLTFLKSDRGICNSPCEWGLSQDRGHFLSI